MSFCLGDGFPWANLPDFTPDQPDSDYVPGVSGTRLTKMKQKNEAFNNSYMVGTNIRSLLRATSRQCTWLDREYVFDL